MDTVKLPEPPERPLDSDCCGGGCSPCVLDIYEEELALWQAECERLSRGETLNCIEESPNCTEFHLETDKYTDLTISDVRQEALDILRFRFELPRNKALGLSIGQHIIIRCTGDNGSSLCRQYTPVSPIDTKGYFEVSIKIYQEGRMSQHVKNWNVGDRVQVRGPAGNLIYTRNKYRRILMFCAGTGVAPMCQVISSVLADEADETYLRLVYACSTYQQLMAKAEIDEWRRFWNFSCLFVLSQEQNSPPVHYKHGEEVVQGRVGEELIRKELGNFTTTALVLVCGTRSFDTDVMSYLKELGVPETNIHKF